MNVTPCLRPSSTRDDGHYGHLHLQPTSNPSRTFLTPRGLQTENPNGLPPAAPPLLPAFLITGILLSAIVCIITWRHFVERRRLLFMDLAMGEDVDEMWPGEGTAMTRVRPEMWEVVVRAGKQEGGSDLGGGREWENMMVRHASFSFIQAMSEFNINLSAPPKPSKPHYLIPSDRPISFWTRMFGGVGEGHGQFRQPREQERLESYSRSAVELPPSVLISTVAPTNTRISEWSREEKEEESIDRVQVVMLVVMPSERRTRGIERKAEAENAENESSVGMDEASLEADAKSLRSDKGKKRSLEKEKSGHDPYDNGNDKDDGDNDDNRLQEVFLGTVLLPYVQEC
ncbi:hypothetical protein BU17DRAFT_99433 [Hysterangium stoloniferum]|nr:hypothetical protein BU17DRAFT_99433 [Hysterangium stoloniferum]